MFDWLFGRSRTDARPTVTPRTPHARPITHGTHVFVCSSCGRTDLPEAGDWDPPICEECDAERNFAAIEEQELGDEDH